MRIALPERHIKASTLFLITRSAHLSGVPMEHPCPNEDRKDGWLCARLVASCTAVGELRYQLLLATILQRSAHPPGTREGRAAALREAPAASMGLELN